MKNSVYDLLDGWRNGPPTTKAVRYPKPKDRLGKRLGIAKLGKLD